MGVGDREATCKVHALGMASCMPICHTLLFSFGFLQKLGNTQAVAVSGSLILGFLALLYFIFLAFCKHSTLNSQAAGSSGPNSLLFASTIVSFPKP